MIPVTKVLAAVITHDDVDTHAMVALLTDHVRPMIELTFYETPLEVSPTRNFDLIIVRQSNDITELAALYERAGLDTPIIVHLIGGNQDDPDYHERFPDLHIAALEQADLDDLAATLQLDAVEKIVSALYTSKLPSGNS